MAKKQERDQEPGRRAGRTDAVRAAVDQAFQATAGQGAAAAETGRERAQEVVDQLAQAAGRVREVLDDIRPPTVDELKALQKTVAALEQRIAALEDAGAEPTRAAAKKKSS
jgi:polyhydroxyalkanoate synthesis regulator phasin